MDLVSKALPLRPDPPGRLLGTGQAQRRRRLELDIDKAERLPTLLTDVVLQVAGERANSEVVVGGKAFRGRSC